MKILSADEAVQPINITFIESERTIDQILQLQKAMVLLENQKQLPEEPKAYCFKVNIKQFLPKNARLQPIFGCIFSDQVSMNASLLRAGLYIHTDMGLASDDQLFNSKLMKTVGGHDFSGTQLVEYYKNTVVNNNTSPDHAQLKSIELDFNKTVMQAIIQQNSVNFIFFSIINTSKFEENLSHELLHAQYYDTPQMEDLLLQVWDQVPATDKNIITECLKNGGYDVKQQELLLREFYSYFLQYKAADYLTTIKVLEPMAPLAKIYGPKIKNALAKENIRVLTVN